MSAQRGCAGNVPFRDKGNLFAAREGPSASEAELKLISKVFR